MMVGLDPGTTEILKVALPAGGAFVLGLLTRATMTKKERVDVARTAFQDTRDLMERQENTFHEYAETIDAYNKSDGDGEVDHFLGIAVKGDIYFYQLKLICDAIISDKVDPVARDNTLLPKIREATLRTLPAHYETLQAIAKKKGFNYEGELRRENYQGLYAVLEKYGDRADWQREIEKV